MRFQTLRKHFERELTNLIKKYVPRYIKHKKIMLIQVNIIDIKK